VFSEPEEKVFPCMSDEISGKVLGFSNPLTHPVRNLFDAPITEIYITLAYSNFRKVCHKEVK
jgi:hypothetical protein